MASSSNGGLNTKRLYVRSVMPAYSSLVVIFGSTGGRKPRFNLTGISS